jgi:hypothetical protein
MHSDLVAAHFDARQQNGNPTRRSVVLFFISSPYHVGKHWRFNVKDVMMHLEKFCTTTKYMIL